MSWTLQGSERARGTYWQATTGSGKARRTITIGYATEAEARARIAALDTPQPLPVPVVQLVESPKGPTLRAFYTNTWLPVRAREAASGTVYRERSLWKPILKTLGDVPLNDLSMVLWSSFLASQTQWAGRAQSLAQNAYRTALTYAVEVGLLSAVHAFRPIKGSTTRSRPAGEALTVEEVGQLLDAAPSPAHRALFAVLCGVGLRPGEASAIQWEDVDWVHQRLLVRGTKTATSRATIPLTPTAHDELQTWWETCSRPDLGPAFTWRGKPIGDWKKGWARAVQAAGLNPDGRRRIIPYSGRYTFATLGVVAGVPDAAIRATMRHTSKSAVLQTVYQRLSVEQVAEEVQIFPRFGS